MILNQNLKIVNHLIMENLEYIIKVKKIKKLTSLLPHILMSHKLSPNKNNMKVFGVVSFSDKYSMTC
jgi:hypothetical protein